MKNYSRQREAILEALRSTDSHPTALKICEMVREKIPNISLGTVYRNLEALSQSGVILNLSVGDGFEHYDGDIRPHLHLFCRCCGRIFDKELSDRYSLAEAAIEMGFKPQSIVCTVCGICSGCNDETNEQNKTEVKL